MQNSFYEKPPIVIDTNLLISAMIAPNSMIHEAIYKALKEYVIVFLKIRLMSLLKLLVEINFYDLSKIYRGVKNLSQISSMPVK